MSDGYAELIRIVIDSAQARSDLKGLKTQFAKDAVDLAKMSKIQFTVDPVFKLNLDKAHRNILTTQAQTNAARIKAEQEFQAILTKHQIDAATTREKAELALITSTANAEAAAKTNAAQISAKVQREVARTTLLENKATTSAVEKQFVEAERMKQAAIRRTAAEQRAANAQARMFNTTFMPGGSRLPIAAATPKGFHASSALRASAGAAGALGAYPAAGTLYAAANAMQMLGISTISYGTALASVAAIGPVAIFTGMMLAGKELNQELAKMSTLMASASTTSAEFRAILDATTESAVRLAGEFNIGTVDVVKAFKEALSSGIEADELERFTRQAAKLSTGLDISLTSSANVLTSFKDSYQLSIGELSKASDILFNTVNLGKVDVNQLVTNFGRLLPVGKAAGITLEDLASGLSVMTRRGMTASQSVTSMIQIINGLTNPSDKARKKMEELGIAYGDAAFQGKTWLQVMTDVANKTGGSGTAIGEIFREDRASRGVALQTDALSLLGDIVEGTKELGTSAIASDRAMDTLWTNIGKRVEKVWSSVQGFGNYIANDLNVSLFGSSSEVALEKAIYQEKINDAKAYATTLILQGKTFKEVSEVTRAELVKDIYQWDEYSGVMVKVGTTAEQVAKGIAEAFSSAKDLASITMREVDENLANIQRGLNKFIIETSSENRPIKEMKKETDKRFGSRITEDQKEYLDDLMFELEIKKEILEEDNKKRTIELETVIAKEKTKSLTPAIDNLSKAVLKNNPDDIAKYRAQLSEANDKFTKFVTELKASYKETNPLKPLIEEIDTLNDKVNGLQDTVAKQRKTKDVRRDEKFAEDERTKELEAYKKLKSDSVNEAEKYKSIVERIYKQDLKNFEKSQKDKAYVIRRLYKEIEEEAGKSAEFQADVANRMLQSRMAQYGDDPNKQRRIAEDARDAAKRGMDQVASSGASRDEFEAAVSKFREASEMVRDAVSGVDNNRAQRNYQEDLSIEAAAGATFDKSMATGQGVSLQAAKNAHLSNSVRSPQEIAKAASAELAAEKQIERVVLEANVKINVDGTLAKSTLDAISEQVVAKIQQSQRNRNLSSRYDTKSRDDNKVTSE